jgi:hypothetical protein
LENYGAERTGEPGLRKTLETKERTNFKLNESYFENPSFLFESGLP